MSIFLFILGLLLFIGLIVVHEYGHFLAARRGGVAIEEFGIFFGPKLYKRRMKGGWDFTVRLLPLGGFVKLKGEHDSDTEKHSFGAASLTTKTKIMAAGVVMNLITALILFTFLALTGMPKLIENQFTVKSDTKVSQQLVILSYVEPHSPADKAGLKAQDTLLTVQGASVTSPKQLHDLTTKNAGQKVALTYKHNGTVMTAQAVLQTKAIVDASQKTDNPKGYLGVSPTAFTLQRSTWSAPVVAVGLSAQLTKLTVQGVAKALGGLGSIFAGAATGNTVARQHGQTSASSQVSGPLGIYFLLKTGSALGFQFMLLIIAIISLTLAIMNFLPIPALDGGRLWLTLISRGVFKKPLSARREEIINASGFAVLMLLFIVITFVDYHRLP